MAELDFKGKASAEAWKAEAQDLNDRTNEKLRQVSACLQEIQGESVGDMVDRLVECGAELLDATAQMVSALNVIVSLVDSLIGAFMQAIADAVTGIDGKKSTMTMGY